MPKAGSKQKSCSILLGVMTAFLIIGAIVVAFILMAAGNDFCGGDIAVRSFLASHFEESVVANNSLIDFETQIKCVPSDAFGTLTEQQKATLATMKSLQFRFKTLENMADSAFTAPELGGITLVSITDNILSFLGDNVFASFPELTDVVLANNLFSR